MKIWRKWKASYWAAVQHRLEDRAERLINIQLMRFDLTTDEGKDRLESFIDRLSDRRKNLHIKPEFTPQVVGACQQILAFGMAGLGLILAFWSKLADLAPFWQSVAKTALLISLNLTAIAFFVLVWFFVQARSRYPFLFLERCGNALPFFYYETLRRSSHYRPLATRYGIVKANSSYLGDFASFTRALVDEDEDLLIRARYELQQYYLLIAYQGYLDQYEMQLEHIFLYCSIAGVSSAVLVCAWRLF